MSQGATLSPSPMNFGDSSSNFLSSTHFLPASSNNSQSSFFEQRRTPHPHNPPLFRFSENMSERSQSQFRPALGSQPSIIDLTDEPDDRPPAPRNRSRSHSHRPPQLGRSDAVSFAHFVDLTDDADPEVIFTGDRVLPRPPQSSIPRTSNSHRGSAPATSRRDDSPSLFVPLAPPAPQRQVHRMYAAHGSILGALGAWGARMDGLAGPPGIVENMQNFMEHVGYHLYQHDHAPQAMPGNMDYQHQAFAQRKAEHVAPPSAREGFTRSPTEEDTVICPSCEEELIHRKDAEVPILPKKGSKSPGRREREEHPFWVVRECGHVYCNSCFQNRSTPQKSFTNVTFPEIPKTGKGRGTKVLGCAVDGCESEVKSKDKWVGVFL